MSRQFPPRAETVTLQTIADRLGVSRTTVSNAYGKPDQLNPALRGKILEVAKELGYPGPNPAARTLRRGRAGAVGLLLCETLAYAFTDPAAILLLQGVAQATDAADVGLVLLPSPKIAGGDPAAVRAAVVDGFVVYSVPDGTPAVEAIFERHLPTVIIDEPRRQDHPFVGIDDRSGARAAADHLLALGHRRFGVVADFLTVPPTGPPDPDRPAGVAVATAHGRVNGYADALRAAGLPWEEVRIEEARANTPDAGCAAAAALLDRSPRPTAILALTDQLALGVLAAARQRGVAVPAALSVVGFDDIPAAAGALPPLTTVRQPLLEKGRRAGQLLLDGWAEDAPPPAILPTELVVRASTGPDPDGGERGRGTGVGRQAAKDPP